jgi:hypothetical protein
MALEPIRLSEGPGLFSCAAIEMEEAKVDGPAGWILRLGTQKQ